MLLWGDEMEENYVVTKSNYFIMNSSYDLSLEEQKLILTLAGMVQPEDEEFKPYKFRISDFMKLLGVENQAKYTEIPKITKGLMKKVFEIEEGNKLIQTAWLTSAVYEKGSGEVELKFSSYLKPYMLKLNSMFTQYKLANILNMKSKYSPRIYEILKCNEYKKQGYIDIEVEELRNLLKADNIYPLYADFKRKIIIQTQKELKKISDISFDFEEIKTGRKVTTIRFFIHKNNIKILNESNTNDEISIDALGNSDTNSISSNSDINTIVSMMKEHKVNSSEATKIFNSANGDMNHISKVYNYCKNREVENFVGFMIHMVKPGEFNEPKSSTSSTSFNNFTPRNYDYDTLEKKLLGWE